MKTTIRKAYNASTRRNSIMAAILFAILAFAAFPGLFAAQDPPQIAQYKLRIQQIDGQIVQRNNAITTRTGQISEWRNWVNSGMWTYYSFDWNRYNRDPNYKASWDPYIAQQRENATRNIGKMQREIAQWQQEIKQLQDDRAWQVWGIQSYSNPGGGTSTAGPQITPPQAPSTGSAGNAGGQGLLGAGGMQH
jgi:hypothetical protein